MCERDMVEVISSGGTEVVAQTPAISAPPSQLHASPSTLSQFITSIPRNPKTRSSSFVTPLDSPEMNQIVNINVNMDIEGCQEDVKLDPQEAWLPITESRNGNAYYSAFHTINSGIGFQALLLPVAFSILGWTWGIICLLLVFVWQFYTLWLLIQLHQTVPGTRYSRYLQLSQAAFGEKLGKLLVLFPIMYLSGGTCVSLIIMGGGTMKLFFQTLCGETCDVKPLTSIEWFLVFMVLAILLAQLPNLNSIAKVSLVGSITTVGYCTLLWVTPIVLGRPTDVSYDDPLKEKSVMARVSSVFNAIGTIAFVFRGHNLVLEIQGTMPSSLEEPSRVPMWKGVKAAYVLIMMTVFPIAIGGYWAYGNLIPAKGMLSALYKFHGNDTSKFLLGLINLLVVISFLSSFQIYAMAVFDNLEIKYTSKKNKPCPQRLRSGFRVLFGCLAFFIASAVPFLLALAGLLGAIALPVTLVYPCFMWIAIKKPQRYSSSWYLNSGLGSLGVALSVLLFIAALWNLVDSGIEARFFNPQSVIQS